MFETTSKTERAVEIQLNICILFYSVEYTAETVRYKISPKLITSRNEVLRDQCVRRFNFYSLTASLTISIVKNKTNIQIIFSR